MFVFSDPFKEEDKRDLLSAGCALMIVYCWIPSLLKERRRQY